MKFERRFTTADRPVFEQVEWEIREASIPGAGFRMDVEVPRGWSQDATNVFAQKYLRKAGVPDRVGLAGFAHNSATMPMWLWPWQAAPTATFGPETSARQVFHRMAGCWTYWGWCDGYFGGDEESARTFYDELYWMLAHQYAAPNSPQWFNTGLRWAYRIRGSDVGAWAFDHNGEILQPGNSYERPQVHACFLTPTEDNLVGPGGIMDTWSREARVFKQGSGSGVNVSAWRAKGELLSGGGRSSGVMGFLRIGDSAAGAIQSGGTTRRAAKMVCLDADHPEIEDFVDWKVREEAKAAAMHVGSQVLRNYYMGNGDARRDPLVAVPDAVVDRMAQGFEPEPLGVGWEGEAIKTVDGQNSNNSVRAIDEFMRCVEEDLDWDLTNRTDGSVAKTVKARGLWDRICRAAWASADPGLIFDDTVNAWGTCAADGRIRTTNPCCEFHHLDGSACNLASLNLGKFIRMTMKEVYSGDSPVSIARGKLDFDTDAFEHACRLWTVVLDISVSMAGFPAREFAEGARDYRTLGLGYANLGGLLLSMGLGYDSDGGRSLAAAVTALMTGVAYRTSAEMAAELVPFPRWKMNAEPMRKVLRKHRKAIRHVSCDGLAGALVIRSERVWDGVINATSFRNAQVTLLAPTGTIALVMDCDTTGVEPYYTRSAMKQLAGGGEMAIANDVPEGECAVPSHPGGPCLRPEAHVLMVAAVQPFLSGGVSKTVNLPHDATVGDVDSIYRMAHRLGLKSISIYRDGSKLTQPLAVAKGEQKFEPTADLRVFPDTMARFARKVIGDGNLLDGKELLDGKLLDSGDGLKRGERERLPARRRGWTQKVTIGGQTIYLRTGEHEDGRLAEIFLDFSKDGSTTRALLGCLAKAVSIALQHGTPLAAMVKAFVHTRFEPGGLVRGDDRIKFCDSFADYVFRRLAVDYLGRDDLAHVPGADAMDAVVQAAERMRPELARATHAAPDMVMRAEVVGEECPDCHAWGKMRRTGTCVQCMACGWDEGCG